MKRSHLALRDLLHMIENADYQGFGYIGHSIRQPSSWADLDDPYAHVRALDQAVIDAAEQRRYSVDQLFAWANSRHGRHAADGVFGLPSASYVLHFGESMDAYVAWAAGEVDDRRRIKKAKKA